MIDLYVQITYANRVGVYLNNFKQKKPRLWEFSHSCEKKEHNRKQKVRAYIYQPKDNSGLNVYCHHCGFSTSLGNFIKEISPTLYGEFQLEGFRDAPKQIIKTEPKKEELIDANLSGLIPVSKLPESSSVIRFLERRKIPTNKYNLLYVAKEFFPWASKYKPEFKELKDNSPRLVLPYFDLHGRVIGFTARTFSPTVEPRYIHLRLDKNVDFIYGTERIDPSKRIYVTEGQIDSLFVDNSIAVGGANYDTAFLHSIKSNCVLIPDNDWKRNSQVAKQLKKIINEGFAVCFLPDNVKGKDINDIVKNGVSLTEVKELIDNNVFSGLAAQLEFSLRKKVVVS